MKRWLVLIGSIALCQGVGLIGAVFTATALSGWYAHLIKPAFSPPNWLFGPVWTTLYTLMGVVLWWIWSSSHRPERTAALRAFWVQLALNAIWSPIFFGAHALGWSVIVIIALWLAIIWCMIRLREIHRRLSALMAPYLVWVTFAAALDIALWMLN